MDSMSNKLKKRATITQVAEDAGVSKTSVSRFLGKDAMLLSESMRKRIEDSVNRLGFHPDRMASSLRGRRTRLIGMVVADITNPFTVQIMRGIEQSCRLKGYTLVVCNTDLSLETEAEHLQVLRSYNVEGLIVHTQGQPSPVLESLVEEGMPLVLIDRRLEGMDVPCVALDNERAIECGIQHLIEQGFTDVFYVSEPIGDISSRRDRADAFTARMAGLRGQINGKCEEFDLHQHNDALARALIEFHASSHKGCVLCANAPATLRVTALLEEHGLLTTTGILAFDEESWSPLIGGGISTLAQPTEAMGQEAVKRLCSNISKDCGNQAPPPFEAELFQRRSTLTVSTGAIKTA